MERKKNYTREEATRLLARLRVKQSSPDAGLGGRFGAAINIEDILINLETNGLITEAEQHELDFGRAANRLAFIVSARALVEGTVYQKEVNVPELDGD